MADGYSPTLFLESVNCFFFVKNYLQLPTLKNEQHCVGGQTLTHRQSSWWFSNNVRLKLIFPKRRLYIVKLNINA